MRALVVGAGFAGASCARELADRGWFVDVCDLRDHVGGNAYEEAHERGPKFHPYGPHIFHTNSDAVVEFLSRFTSWRPYHHRVKAYIILPQGGKYVPVPLNVTSYEILANIEIPSVQVFRGVIRDLTDGFAVDGKPKNSEESILSRMGLFAYKKVFEPYTVKQWGIHPRDLDAGVCARIPLREDREEGYFSDKFQMMPKDGYEPMFREMLDHHNIRVELSVAVGPGDRSLDAWDHVFWSGPLDQFFAYELGVLPYRSANFVHQVRNDPLEAPVVNYPDRSFPYTRITDMGQVLGYDGTRVHTVETPREYWPEENDPFWPVPTLKNRALRSKYLALATEREPKVSFIGRLGSYQYLDMHQACAQGLQAAKYVDTYGRKFRGEE